MKNFITLTLFLLCAVSSFADETVTWLSKVHDFGAFDEDTKKKTAYFSFVNTTAEPVTIISAAATCGCTVPKYSEDPIAPGDTAVIEVSYDPTGRPGRFEKQIYVRTSDAYDRTKLVIKGAVIGNPETITARYPVSIGPLKLRTGAAMFGKVLVGHQKITYVDGYNQSADTLRPVVSCLPDYLSVRTVPEVVAPGEMMSFDFEFSGANHDRWGIYSDSVMIAPNPGVESVSYPVVVIFDEDFSGLTPEQMATAPISALSADRIELPPIPLNSNEVVTATLKLSNSGSDPLIVRRIFSEDAGVSVSVKDKSVAKDGSTDIVVNYDPSVQPTGIVNARFTLITNDPINPTRVVRIVAERT